MTTIGKLGLGDLDAHEDALVGLLRDSVDGGASVGFMPPLDAEEARVFWRGVRADVARATRVVLAAFERGEVTGSVQLDLCNRANGLHRAEVVKLFVHSAARRRGVGRALMHAIEREARALGRSLLVLDTRKGDPSEALYRSMGYVAAGEIPGYARSASGELHATVLFYKFLDG